MMPMTQEEKKAYLELYALQQARINRYCALSARNSDRKQYYKNKINIAISIRDIIEDDIDSLADKNEGEVLAQKYLCGKSFAETAEMLNFSRRHIERLHLSGLEHLNPSMKRVYELGGRIKHGKNRVTLRS